MMIAVIFGTFLLALLIGCPIGIALLLGGGIPILTMTNLDSAIIVQRLFSAANNYSLMAVPFFILSGSLMDVGGVSKRLVNFARSLVGWLPGGLAVVSFLAGAFFGAITGSAPATVAAIGSIMIPAMKEDGYPLPFILATVASGGWLGVIVPPSIPMVVYGVSVGTVSISELFLGGIIPGFLLAGGMSVYAILWGKKNMPHATKKFSIREVWSSFKEALWALGMPLIILGGIYAGIFTATEAAVVSVIYGLLVSTLIYHQLTLKGLVEMMRKSIITTNVCMFIVLTSTVFAAIMTREQIPVIVGNAIMGIAKTPLMFFVLVILLLLFVGTFMETLPAIMILAPILIPMLSNYNVNSVSFGVIMIITLGIGMLTPPVGINLFTSASLCGEKVETVINRHLFAYIGCALAVLVLLIVFDEIIMLLPNIVRARG